MHVQIIHRTAGRIPSRFDAQIQQSRCSGDAGRLQPSAATSCAAATAAAMEALGDAGNAIDAAVAAAWTLAVCEPGESGIGGQSTMLIWLPSGRTIVLVGTSVGPSGVSLKTVSRKEQRRGYRASTVPTTPLILDYAE